jgi:hypothetical protein
VVNWLLTRLEVCLWLGNGAVWLIVADRTKFCVNFELWGFYDSVMSAPEHHQSTSYSQRACLLQN